MKQELSTLDLTALERELQVLEGARVNKVYQRGDEITVHLYKPGDKKYRLLIGPGKAFLTAYKRDNPTKPPNFCMNLRKHLSGATVQAIGQQGFDRVLRMTTQDHHLIAEIFGDGNLILVDRESMDILMAQEPKEWSERAIYRGEQYQPPSTGAGPSEITADELREMLGSRQLVKTLASGLGLGGQYAEELLARIGMEKDQRGDALDDEAVRRLHEGIQEFLALFRSSELAPTVYHDGEDPVDVAPIQLQTRKGQDHTAYEDFSTALDTYFTEKQKAEYRRKKLQAYREKKDELEHREQQQEEMLEGMQDAIDEKKEIGDLIYRHYGTIKELIETIRSARQQYSDSEIADRLTSEQGQGIREAQMIEDLDLGNDRMTLDLGEHTATIELTKTVEENAEEYYEGSKEARRKVEGAKEALEQTRQELEELEANKEEIDVEDAFRDKEQEKKSKEWYEKFRWFFSSDGFLVIGGRDQQTNESLVKKQMEQYDRYAHADSAGAPSVVVKNPDQEEIPESTLEEAGKLAISYSKDWKMGVTADDAYAVDPDQVTKDPESGEYLGTGAFVIRGERDYMRNLSVSVAVGCLERDGEAVPMGGPVTAIQEHCTHFVEVRPGDTKKSELAKQIQHHLHEATGEDFDLDRIARSLPPGKGRVERTV